MNEFKPYKDGGKLNATASKKGTSSPDYWGDIAINLSDLTAIEKVDGLTIIKLSGWKKQDKSGRTFLSLAVNRYVPEGQKTIQADNNDQDIPF